MESPTRRTPLPGLTALRFFAASYVVLSHFVLVPTVPAVLPALPDRLVSAGFTAVSCFFILSGFILAYTHDRVLSLSRFYRARLARIYPLYLFSLLVCLPLLFKFPDILPRALDRVGAITSDLLLVQDWFPRYSHSLNFPAWTLSCEAFFYLLFPFAVAGVRRLRHHTRSLLAGCFLWQIAPPVINAFWLRFHAPVLSSLLSAVLTMPIARLGEFLAGIVLGLAFLERSGRSDGGRPTSMWLLPLSLVACVACLSLNRIVPPEVASNGLMIIPYCLLIWALANSHWQLLANPILQLGGEVSYGVYLLQIPCAHLLFLLRRLTGGLIGGGGWWLLAIYPIAWLTYITIEKPCRALLLQRRPSRDEKPLPTPQPELL